MCLWLGSEFGPSQSPSVLSVTAQRAVAGVSGLHHGRRGLPQFQLYVHYVAPCRARGGCRAPVSLSGALTGQGAV